MSDNEIPEHLHLLSSYELGWNGLNLIYEREPADEMSEMLLQQHFIVICLEDVRVGWRLNNSWQYVDYTKGDIAIFPADQMFPRAQVSCEVGLVELFLEPATLAGVTYEFVDADKIEIVPQLQLRDPLIEHMGLALMAELQAGKADSKLYAESMATALSAHLLRRYASHPQQIPECNGGLPKYKLKDAIAYIHEHLDQNLTLDKIATSVHMSSHYFASLFKQSTGFTPYQYVTKCRIEKAKELLRRHELTLVEICQRVGFQNQSHFTRVFRQHTSTTPNAYRKFL
ncbi:DNA-binding domain-containing protein, AraC-type [Nostoc sp. PCC 7524]|uniref:helix-turn-helix domain-containing protein n=1 Tax=Nostoc sp. (strain ATCC 29411 / PCC 7524) TaxID=28072 RepID=UPI00029EDD9C|nr:AraC family transcriptional regulator [Nostoc sp. PCC 7524]AFY48217.1 DNA-binding domain-containing protein, AraC-type [Nostoc sp. PCC 7524]